MKKYKLTDSVVQNTETNEFIPNDERNNDWKEYQNWLKGLGPDIPTNPMSEPTEPLSLGTGPNTPDPQYTEEELVAQVQLEQDIINEEKIQNEIRKIAIKNLKESGSLTVDYNG